MSAVEEVLIELNGKEVNEQGLPPGFRFHPIDEELATFYLASKVFNWTLCGIQIAEVDLNRCEPWELPGMDDLQNISQKLGRRRMTFYKDKAISLNLAHLPQDPCPIAEASNKISEISISKPKFSRGSPELSSTARK